MSHSDAIVTLADDEWHMEFESLPIARRAANALARLDIIEDRHLEVLFGISEQTFDGVLRQKIFDALAAKGSDFARERLLTLALQVGKLGFSIAACRALRASTDRLDRMHIAQIAPTHPYTPQCGSIRSTCTNPGRTRFRQTGACHGEGIGSAP